MMTSKMMSILGTSFAFLALCILSAEPGKAQDVVHPDESLSSSAVESTSSGYYEYYGGSAQNVLLLDDANNAGTAALINALTTAGFNVTHRLPPEFTWNTTDPPLDDFACVVHLNGNTPFSGLPAASAFALNEFVRTGGGFIGSQWNGFERVQGRQANMNDLVLQTWADPPVFAGGGENCGGCNINYSVVPAQAGHPVLVGIPASFSFFADGHDAGLQVVYGTDPSTVIMTVSSGRPGVLVREFEAGRVVNFSHAANFTGNLTLQDPTIQQLYVNAAEYACDRVIEIAIDIKPQSCPNPLNCNGKGVLPVAILGTSDLNVTDIDPASVRLEGVPPLRSAVEDVAAPFSFATIEDCDDCTTDGPDGFLDLTLKFDTQEVLAAIGIGPDDDTVCLVLELTGELLDGTPIVGEDVVRILCKKKK